MRMSRAAFTNEMKAYRAASTVRSGSVEIEEVGKMGRFECRGCGTVFRIERGPSAARGIIYGGTACPSCWSQGVTAIGEEGRVSLERHPLLYAAAAFVAFAAGVGVWLWLG